MLNAKKIILSVFSIYFLLALAPIMQAQQNVQGLSLSAQEALKLIESEDYYERQLGFLRLEALRETAILDEVRPYLNHDDASYRAFSLRVFSAIDGIRSVALLLEKLASDEEPQVRRAALLGVEPFIVAAPEILPEAIKAMQDDDTVVRMTAVDIVGRINDSLAQQAIRTRLKRESRPDVLRVLKVAIE